MWVGHDMNKCVTAVKKAFPELKEEEITELANELQEAIRRERGKGIDETVIVNEWAEKLANRLEHIAAVERRNKAFNFLSEMKNHQYVQYKHSTEGLGAVLLCSKPGIKIFLNNHK